MRGRRVLIAGCLLLAQTTEAAPRWVKVLAKVGEHVSFGAGMETAGAYAAGGRNNWQAGMVTAAVGAGIKEYYGDVYLKHSDSFLKATMHFGEIMLGAGAMAAGNHDYACSKPVEIEHCIACRPLPAWKVKR